MKTVELIGTGENFLNRITIACALRSNIYKWDIMRLQSFCKTKEIVKKTKRQPTEWKRSLPTSHQIEA